MSWNPDEHYNSRRVNSDYDSARFASIPCHVFKYLEKRTIVRCFTSMPKYVVILDAPCGTGRLADELPSVGYRVPGLDISSAMLNVAQWRLRNYGDPFGFQVAEVKFCRSSEPLYDAALCAKVWMHFPLEQKIEFPTDVAVLTRSLVVINHSPRSPFAGRVPNQRIRRRIKRGMGNQAPANFPVNDAEIKLLQKSDLCEVGRRSPISLVSEVVYIVAHKTDVFPKQAVSTSYYA